MSRSQSARPSVRAQRSARRAGVVVVAALVALVGAARCGTGPSPQPGGPLDGGRDRVPVERLPEPRPAPRASDLLGDVAELLPPNVGPSLDELPLECSASALWLLLVVDQLAHPDDVATLEASRDLRARLLPVVAPAVVSILEAVDQAVARELGRLRGSPPPGDVAGIAESARAASAAVDRLRGVAAAYDDWFLERCVAP